MTEQTAVIRRTCRFTTVPNDLLRDTNISIEARGLMALLLTYSDGWVFRAAHLQGVCNVGRDKYQRMIRELRDAGYVEIRQGQGESGKFGESQWFLNDAPQPENPATVDPATVKPDSGKSGPLRNTKLKKDQKKTLVGGADQPGLFPVLPDSAPEVGCTPDPIDAGFAAFWKAWPEGPRKSGKSDCAKKYRQTCEGKHPKADKISPEDLNRCALLYVEDLRSRQSMKFIAMPLSWLNGPGWEAFIDKVKTSAETGESDYLRQRRRALLGG